MYSKSYHKSYPKSNYEFSESDCIKWFENPLVNPISKKSIKKNGPIYNQLENDCHRYINGKDEVKEQIMSNNYQQPQTITIDTNGSDSKSFIISDQYKSYPIAELNEGDALKCVIKDEGNISFQDAVYFVKNYSKDSSTKKLKLEQAAIKYGLLDVNEKRDEFYKMKDYKNWCQLSKKDKENIAIQFVLYTLANKDYPVKIMKTHSKWNESFKKYECNSCDDNNKHDESFYKTLDILCAIRKLNMLQYTNTSINYSTPGLQIEFSNGAFSYKLQSFGLEEYYNYSGELVINNKFNFSVYSEDKLNESYNIIGIKMKNLKSIPFQSRDNIKLTEKSSVPNPDKLTYITDLEFKDDCTPLVYFKNASALDCLSNNMYSYYRKFHPLFNRDENISENDWKESLLFLQKQYATSDDIEDKYKDFTSQNLTRFRYEYMKIYSNNYKVHLQPKPEYYFWTVYTLSKYAPQLNDLISVTKINLIYDRSINNGENNIPIIILYPYRGQNKLDELIQLLMNIFNIDIANEIGMDICPRFNYKINKLLYVAQGDGDFKTLLNQYGTLERYYDKSENYGIALKQIL